MNLISANNLAMTLAERELFRGVSLGLAAGEHVGLIGPNGCGKSTLMRILAGQITPEAGEVATRAGCHVAYLPQQPEYPAGRRVIECLFDAENEVSRLVRDYEAARWEVEHSAAGPAHDAAVRRLGELQTRMDHGGAWDFESRAMAVLGRLGVGDPTAEVQTLSGGQRRRIALAAALIAEPDVLLMDEPTNHLDVATIQWMEARLARYGGALMLVTHDRYFLERVTRTIYEMDRGSLVRYEGRFSDYLAAKAEREAAEAQQESARRNILRRELEWLKRGAKARTTKQKARINRAEDLKAAKPEAKAAAVAFESGGQRLGKEVVELEGAGKSFEGRAVLRGVTYRMAPKTKWGIVGPNGCGKTTLINLITGRLAPDEGAVRVGETVKMGYFDQESAAMDLEMKALDWVKTEGGESIRRPDGSVLAAERFLERFGFSGRMQHTPIGKLSGGERRRLQLVGVLMRDPNFLILDEPTNDLDIPTLQALEDYLEGFGGCVLAVSHDRYFLDRTVDRLLAFEENKSAGEGEPEYRVREWPGSWSDYEPEGEDEDSEAESSKSQKPINKSQTNSNAQNINEGDGGKAKKLSYKEKREFELLEPEIERMEKRLGELDGEIAAAATDYTKLQKLTSEQGELQAKLDAALARWEELAERG